MLCWSNLSTSPLEEVVHVLENGYPLVEVKLFSFKKLSHEFNEVSYFVPSPSRAAIWVSKFKFQLITMKVEKKGISR